MQSLIVFLAGNFSSLLATSGAFSGDIALTAGQYGYELISGFALEHGTYPCLYVDILHYACGHARGSDLEPHRP